jgi:WG containing repeat
VIYAIWKLQASLPKRTMTKTTLTIIFILTVYLSYGQTRPLFKITEGDRIGYINDKGNVVIKPIFLNGNDFSEGLAAVRLNGTYGFINEAGIFVIKPDYDFAKNFVNGLAVVYKNGEPLFIDKLGNVALPSVFKALTFIDNRKGIITTPTNKQGVIDILSKQLIIDTIFSSIGDFKSEVAIVTEYITPTQKEKKKRIGLIDSKGKFVVPFGKYETIKSFYEGYAVVEIDDEKSKDGNTDGVIDTKGNLLFKRENKNNSYVDGDFHNGYAKVSLYKYWIPEEKGISYTTAKNYEGFINLNGEIVLNDTNYRYVKDFSNNRAFVKEDNNDYVLIDKNFKRVGNNSFQNIPSESFKNGYAVIETSEGYGIVDTLGNLVTKSDYADIDNIGIVDDYFFFTMESDDSKSLYGISNLKGNIICKPIMKEFDRNGFTNGLIKAIIDDKLCYINKSGEIIWQQKNDTTKALKPLNIDFMNRGYFYAYSTPKNTEADYSGGWATSSNRPKKNVDKKFQDNLLTVTIDTNIVDTFSNQFFGIKLFISNTTKDTIKFNAQDSRLYLKMQAQNNKGEWKDIEYLPSSWCGNSYHTVELEPNAFWSFTIPKYDGEVKTKIRAQLRYINKDNLKTDKVIYSNEISGSINLGQFWNKRTYYPNGLMDPYNN